MNIGKNIRSLRMQNNINQNDLAKHIGVSKSTMSNYERNYSTPDPDTLVKLADFFNVSIDYLFDYEDTSKANLTKESSNYNKANSAVLSKDELNVLKYYNRLNDERKDYIKGQMIQLYFEQIGINKKDNN